MSNKKSFDKRKSYKKGESGSQIYDIISQTQFINNIINNHFESNMEQLKKNNNDYCILEQYFSSYKPKNFYKYYYKIKYISNIKSFYKVDKDKIKNKNYIISFIYLIIYLIRVNDSKINNKKEILLENIIEILHKLYSINLFQNSDILIIIKFIIYSSIYVY